MRTVLLVMALVGAGCLAPASNLEGALLEDAPRAADPMGGFANPLVLDHDHDDVALHALATPNVKALARVAFDGVGEVPGAIYGEMDLLGEDMVVVATVGTGFSILDVKDRASPRIVSSTLDPAYVADVKASEDGRFVFVAVELAGAATGVHVFNVMVPERPVLVGEFPMQNGCHMIAVHREHLYCAPGDDTIRIFAIVTTPVTAALVPVGAYAPLAAPFAPVTVERDAEHMTHDMTVQDDPLTGEPIMLVSFWDYGVRVVDVADPAKPVEIGAWTGEGAEDTYGGQVHTTMAGLLDGRRILVTVPEFATIPSVTVLDATDLDAIRPLGVWAPIADFGSDSPRTFSTHNFQLLGSRVYLGMYHGGVWVLDIAKPDEIRPLGYILPAAPALLPVGGLVDSPSVWDVVLRDGHVYATDLATGVHVLAMDGDAGNAALTSWA